MVRWKRKKLPAALCLAMGVPMLGMSPAAWAVTQYLGDFNALYGTAGTRLDSCLVCHVSANGGNRNDYGNAFAAAKTSNNTAGVQAALSAIEGDDSDGDGVVNIEEIGALTFPGDCTDPDPAGCGQNPEIPPGTVTEGPTVIGCYLWDRFPNERFVLSIKRYGGLVTTEPRNDFIEAQNQTNHGIHGKHVGACGPDTLTAVDGTLLKARAMGAHVGLRSVAVQGDGTLGGEDTCRDVIIDCTSEEDVQTPREFECRSRNEFDVFHGESELKLVQNAAEDPLCTNFGELPDRVPDNSAASGLRAENGGSGHEEHHGNREQHHDSRR